MNILAALEAVIEPAINYAEKEIASIGAAFASGLSIIAQGFLPAQRVVLTNVIAFWQAHYKANIAAGQDFINAVENASTAALNEFAGEEAAEGRKEIMAILTLLESSVKSAA